MKDIKVRFDAKPLKGLGKFDDRPDAKLYKPIVAVTTKMSWDDFLEAFYNAYKENGGLLERGVAHLAPDKIRGRLTEALETGIWHCITTVMEGGHPPANQGDVPRSIAKLLDKIPAKYSKLFCLAMPDLIYISGIPMDKANGAPAADSIETFVLL